jgi:hypothetical protein
MRISLRAMAQAQARNDNQFPIRTNGAQYRLRYRCGVDGNWLIERLAP